MPNETHFALEGLEELKLPNVHKLILGETQKEKRMHIRSGTKKAVYERAEKRCECCGMPLEMNQGQFHHLKEPSVKAKPKDLQFLCPTHHYVPDLAHVRKTRSVRTPLGMKKKSYIKRKRVHKDPSSTYWEEKPKTTKRKTTTRRKLTKKTTKRSGATKKTTKKKTTKK